MRKFLLLFVSLFMTMGMFAQTTVYGPRTLVHTEKMMFPLVELMLMLAQMEGQLQKFMLKQ